ncbi:MAG: hypothetical protein MUC48_14990 [Leptolyngbya sp. Prado105]|jgi:plasmid stability protein|nr:hypothetical protein [Leptolyngbya sp. Prado105]
MATITIPNVPDEIVDRIKQLAEQKGISVEQEIQNVLQNHYMPRDVPRDEVLKRIRQRWESLPLKSARQSITSQIVIGLSQSSLLEAAIAVFKF